MRLAHPLARLRQGGREHRVRGDGHMQAVQTRHQVSARAVQRPVAQRRDPRAREPTGPEPAREHGGGHEARTGPSIRIRVYKVQHPALTAERGGRAVARRGRRR